MEQQIFTMIDSDGESADYLVLKDMKKRARLESQGFEKFYEEENKLDSLERRFKTNKPYQQLEKRSDHYDGGRKGNTQKTSV